MKTRLYSSLFKDSLSTVGQKLPDSTSKCASPRKSRRKHMYKNVDAPDRKESFISFSLLLFTFRLPNSFLVLLRAIYSICAAPNRSVVEYANVSYRHHLLPMIDYVAVPDTRRYWYLENQAGDSSSGTLMIVTTDSLPLTREMITNRRSHLEKRFCQVFQNLHQRFVRAGFVENRSQRCPIPLSTRNELSQYCS